jgi:HD-like signal output (HDOD) protein
MTPEQTYSPDLEELLAGINSLAAKRPVAARIVAATDAEDTDARELSRVLAMDLPLCGRVMKLANSAYYGMRGRVSSLQLAVTVVGFITVRTMATVALTEHADGFRLPEDFWIVSSSLAATAARLAPAFGERPGDALCIGVLAQLGSALLLHRDPDGYRSLLASTAGFADRRRLEKARYGLSSTDVTVLALETWGFPQSIIAPMQRIDDRTSLAGGLLRACYEVVSRLTIDDHKPTAIGVLTRGTLREEDLGPVLYDVRNEAADLRRLLLED